MNNIKKTYAKPEIEAVELEMNDLICTSGDGVPGVDVPGFQGGDEE